MDYGRPDLADRLAAGYATGTLRGAARRRFEALLPAHAALRNATTAWQERLMPLTLSIPADKPPARVWTRIEARTFGAAGATQPRSGFFSRLAFWRGLSTFAGVAALAFAVLLANPSPVQPPIVVVLSSTGADVPNGSATAGGVAAASFVASISGDGRAMVTRPLINVGSKPIDRWSCGPFRQAANPNRWV